MARRPTMPNAENCSLTELDTAIKCAPSQRSSERLSVIKALLIGISHDQTAILYRASRRTLYGWIKKFKEQGIDGLTDKPRPGRPLKITKTQTEK